ncbi:MAG: GGDEF domain-containing response regulator [Candidatus Binatia bacterium]
MSLSIVEDKVQSAYYPSIASIMAIKEAAQSLRESMPLTVLVVEDDQDLREIMVRMVKGMGHNVSTAATGEEAVRRLREHLPDIVLLDLMMPQMDGFEFCRFVQADDTLRDLHIIIASAKNALEDKVKGLELGATDYLTKPFRLPELRARIGAGERIVRSRQALKQQQTRLERMAWEDELTGLSNRRYFEQRAQEECLRARRYDRPLSLVLADLDHFKDVNDHYGHAYGDLVLKEVSHVLRQYCRSSDVVARYGGEEFAMLLPETTFAEALSVAERLRRAVKALSFPHPSGAFQATMSFGVTCLTSERRQQSLAQLCEEADQALYAAKQKGRDRVEAFFPAR